MDTLLRDLRFVARSFTRAPGFFLITGLTLALGIGATTAIFSVVNGVVLQPLPYPRSDRIVQLFGTGQLLQRLGLAVGLSLTPVINALGSAALAFSPRLGMLIAVQAARRASHYAVERPSREVLFTVVAAEDKYKAKNFLDTFVYRLGDFGGSQFFGALGALGLAIRGTALVAIPISAVWLVLVLFLARRANVARHEEAGLPLGGSREPADSA